MKELKVTYISNAGILLETESKKIMVDGICSGGDFIYKGMPKEIFHKLISDIEPYKNIDILIFTHNHLDHFDLRRTLEFLNSQKNNITVIAPQCIIREIKENDSFEGRQIEFIEAVETNGENSSMIVGTDFNISPIKLIHQGIEYIDLENYGYCFDMKNGRILVLGDGEISYENFKNSNLLEKKIDLLLAPFPAVGIKSSRDIIKKYIDPKVILACHFPYEHLDEYGWIKATKKSNEKMKDDLLKVIFLEDIGEEHRFNFEK